MASMKTRTIYTFPSLVELQKVASKALAPKETLRKKAFSLAWGSCCLGMGVFMIAHDYSVLLALLLVIPGTVLMLRYVFFYQLLALGARLAMKEEQLENVFEFEGDRIIARQGENSAKYPYKQCGELLETPNSFYFIMDNGQGLMLDKAGLQGGSVDELRELLKQKTGKTAQNVNIK